MRKRNSSLVRCQQCGAWAASLEDNPKGCALKQTDEPGMCSPMRLHLSEMALRRAIMPEAFDDRLRIKPGWAIRVLVAEHEAIRSVAALLGPVTEIAAATRTYEGEDGA